jgi:ribonuclease HII
MTPLDEEKHAASLLAFERAAAAQGFVRVAGVDEAGRGPLAGPIVAGAVILAGPVAGVYDSKALRETERERLFEVLHGGGHAIGVGVVEAEEIDRLGIQQANYRAMALAVAALPETPDFVLVDGFRVPGLAAPQERIIKGDRRSLSIAAASIIAKVTRDRRMVALEAMYPGYGFARHKGYGTREHLEAIARLGPCPAHRRSFSPLAQGAETRALFEHD